MDLLNHPGHFPVQLELTQAQVEDVSVLATTDHSLFELSAVVGNDVFEASFLQFYSSFKVLAHHFFSQEEQHSSLKKLMVSAHFQHVVNQTPIVLKLL